MISMGVAIIIAVIPSVLSGAILFALRHWNKKNEKREDMRREESILVLQNIDAIGTLADRSARCIKGEKVNGELEDAIAHRTKMKHALENHLMKVNADAKI